MLLGEPLPTNPVERPSYVRNDIGALNEAFVQDRRNQSAHDSVEEFRHVTQRALERLVALEDDEWERIGWSPEGEAPYHRFMETRLLDSWIHLQDIRDGLAMPSDDHGVGEEVVLNRFESDATATGGKGFMDLVYPYATLKPLRELLRNRVQTGDGNEESDKVWREDLAVAVGDAHVDAKVVMGHIKTTLHDLQTMKEGDLLFFKKPELAQFITNEVPSFGVEIGSRGSHVAVRIEKQLVPGHL